MIKYEAPILLVENQKAQYGKVHGRLEAFIVFPVPEEYDLFMEWVRIWVNTGYKKPRRDTVFNQIKEYIQKKGIRLLIMDYKISGNYDGRSGLDLAQELVAQPGLQHLQVLYLSRTPYNSKDLEEKRHLVDEKDWVEKGYAGMNILEPHYFEKYVKTEIIKRLQLTVQPSSSPTTDASCPTIQEMIDNLDIKQLFRTRYFDKFHYLINITPRTGIEEECITTLYQLVNPVPGSSMASNSMIDKVFSDYEIKKKARL